ncbi:hypothetical protein ACIFOC_00213 [Leucobacter aridicollis]|uniref:hypothetical protein n=1 Tax=Leucobacter aridicollis TaxID=283878 RepID=UPI000EB35337|nr:hypothetical protein [Leucobacter aridicollis]MCS3426552.1 hypothetical protein [Leucobacter aridicollis]RKQ89297.1 hypothetical protein U746_1627 [Mycolicibacterium mucogenicum 261Sha1.1M5]
MTPNDNTQHEAAQVAETVAADATQPAAELVDDNPEQVPAKAWVTMGLFAVFVIAFGTCASTFMFN